MTIRPRRRGFTLIELMLVVAIIGLLSAIAIPKFADLILKSKEAAVKGRLGSFRSALSIYYADNDGVYPQHFTYAVPWGAPLVSKYLDAIPSPDVPGQSVYHQGTLVAGSTMADPDDLPLMAIQWGYNSLDGALYVNCTHLDSRNTVWSRY